MKKIIALIIFLILSTSLALAHSDENEIEKGKNIVESKTECEKLSNEDLEAVGEYLMEQMHPGELHDLMHKKMGIEEDTEQHELFHINIAKTMYCGTGSMMSGMNYNMMGGGRMGNYGMMGSGMYEGTAFWWLWSVLALLFLLGLVVLVWVLVAKYWRETQRKK